MFLFLLSSSKCNNAKCQFQRQKTKTEDRGLKKEKGKGKQGGKIPDGLG
jgi:hypothetical protein